MPTTTRYRTSWASNSLNRSRKSRLISTSAMQRLPLEPHLARRRESLGRRHRGPELVAGPILLLPRAYDALRRVPEPLLGAALGVGVALRHQTVVSAPTSMWSTKVSRFALTRVGWKICRACR